MSRTERRKWDFDGHLTRGRESTCKPGCGLCGKNPSALRAERKRERQAGQRKANEESP